MSLDSNDHKEILAHTASIVAAHLSNTQTAPDDIPSLIQKVYRSLTNINGDSVIASERPQPAVPVKRSVTPEYIICLEDGKKLKMLKRHLKTAYNMSPEQYRERWGLPADYPMVAPVYANQRSNLAKNIGLGKRGRSK